MHHIYIEIVIVAYNLKRYLTKSNMTSLSSPQVWYASGLSKPLMFITSLNILLYMLKFWLWKSRLTACVSMWKISCHKVYLKMSITIHIFLPGHWLVLHTWRKYPELSGYHCSLLDEWHTVQHTYAELWHSEGKNTNIHTCINFHSHIPPL